MTSPYIMVAPNGARRTRNDHAALPMTVDQIVETAKACSLAGANGLHLHIRDAKGQHSLDAGRYRETLAALQDHAPALEIQITTESAGIYDVPAQLACLQQLCPEWASISVREIARAPQLADHVYALCAEQGTKVQHILYDPEDAAQLDRWQAQGLVRETQVDRLMVLGRYAQGMESRPADLLPFLDRGVPNNPWMVCAFGSQEHACLARAAQYGADLRVGFENSLCSEQAAQWIDNAESVSALVTRLTELQKGDAA